MMIPQAHPSEEFRGTDLPLHVYLGILHSSLSCIVSSVLVHLDLALCLTSRGD